LPLTSTISSPRELAWIIHHVPETATVWLPQAA
jgi:hypothetical protein